MEDCGYKEIGKGKNNTGLDMLRVWMCFQVVLCHYWHVENYSEDWTLFIQMRDYAVCIFMLMSWILVERNITRGSILYLKKRLWRLAYPLIGWAVIYYFCYWISERLFGMQIVGGIDEMLWQMLTGHSYNVNPSMWYQATLICLTILLFFVFYFFSEKKALMITIGLGFIALLFQYSGINRAIFSPMRYELRYPIGRFMEMLPYCVVGILLSRYSVLKKLDRYKKYMIVPLLILYAVLIYLKSQYLLQSPLGFGYSGIWGIIISLIVIVLAYYLPISETKWIQKMTKYTMGIYCMHRLVGNFYCVVFARIGIPKGTFNLCILIYITCYFASMVMAKMPIKLIRNLVE